MESKERGWIEKKLGYIGTLKDNVALLGTAVLVYFGGLGFVYGLGAVGDWWTAQITPVWSTWSAQRASPSSFDWRAVAFIIGLVALLSAAVWVRDAIRELREANARLVHDIAQLRVEDRLKGLASAYHRIEIRVEDLFGTLEGFSLGMSEDSVYKLLSAHGDFTVDTTHGLTYSMPIVGWRNGDWSAGLVIRGGLLHEVWLMGTDWRAGTRSFLEGELVTRFGEPQPKLSLTDSVAEEQRVAVEQLDRNSIAWTLALPSNPVRAKLWATTEC